MSQEINIAMKPEVILSVLGANEGSGSKNKRKISLVAPPQTTEAEDFSHLLGDDYVLPSTTEAETSVNRSTVHRKFEKIKPLLEEAIRIISKSIDDDGVKRSTFSSDKNAMESLTSKIGKFFNKELLHNNGNMKIQNDTTLDSIICSNISTFVESISGNNKGTKFNEVQLVLNTLARAAFYNNTNNDLTYRYIEKRLGLNRKLVSTLDINDTHSPVKKKINSSLSPTPPLSATHVAPRTEQHPAIDLLGGPSPSASMSLSSPSRDKVVPFKLPDMSPLGVLETSNTFNTISVALALSDLTKTQLRKPSDSGDCLVENAEIHVMNDTFYYSPNETGLEQENEQDDEHDDEDVQFLAHCFCMDCNVSGSPPQQVREEESNMEDSLSSFPVENDADIDEPISKSNLSSFALKRQNGIIKGAQINKSTVSSKKLPDANNNPRKLPTALNNLTPSRETRIDSGYAFRVCAYQFQHHECCTELNTNLEGIFVRAPQSDGSRDVEYHSRRVRFKTWLELYIMFLKDPTYLSTQRNVTYVSKKTGKLVVPKMSFSNLVSCACHCIVPESQHDCADIIMVGMFQLLKTLRVFIQHIPLRKGDNAITLNCGCEICSSEDYRRFIDSTISLESFVKFACCIDKFQDYPTLDRLPAINSKGQSFHDAVTSTIEKANQAASQASVHKKHGVNRKPLVVVFRRKQ
jgi:hypothetical protein